jgi:hypothetical protein
MLINCLKIWQMDDQKQLYDEKKWLKIYSTRTMMLLNCYLTEVFSFFFKFIINLQRLFFSYLLVVFICFAADVLLPFFNVLSPLTSICRLKIGKYTTMRKEKQRVKYVCVHRFFFWFRKIIWQGKKIRKEREREKTRKYKGK